MFETEPRNLGTSLPLSFRHVLQELEVEVQISLILKFRFIKNTLQTVNGGVVRHQRTPRIVSGRCLHFELGSNVRYVRQKTKGFRVRALTKGLERRISSGISHCGRRDPKLANKLFEWAISSVDLLENDGSISWKEFLHPVPNILDQQDSITKSNRSNATRRSHDWDGRCGRRRLSEKSKRRPINKKNRNLVKVIERIRGVRRV